MIRDVTDVDLVELTRLHQGQSGGGLFFHDPGGTHSIGAVADFDADGRIIAAISGRLTAEAFLILDSERGRVGAMRSILRLVRAACGKARGLGIPEVHIGVPADMAGYADLLEKIPGFYPERRRSIIVNVDEVCKATAGVDEGRRPVSWDYVCGVLPEHGAFVIASFAIGNKFRVHASLLDSGKSVTEYGDKHTSSLFSVVASGPDPSVSIPRREASYLVGDTTVIAVIDGKEYVVPAWAESESGPVDPAAGWKWFSIRCGSETYLLYDICSPRGNECVGYSVSDKLTPVKWSYELAPAENGGALTIDGRNFKFHVRSAVRVVDDEIRSDYVEARIDVEGLGAGFLEIVGRVVQHGASGITAKFHEWALGNTDAAKLLGLLYSASQTADDIVDEATDRGTRSRLVSSLLRLLLTELPANPFYRAHWEFLSAVLSDVIDRWALSNDLEDSPDESLRALAYGMRECATSGLTAVARLVGGPSHAFAVLRDAVRYFHGPGMAKTFSDWSKGGGSDGGTFRQHE